VLKPGYAVAHEEVGFVWLKLTVHGAMSYSGIRHKGVYDSPIVKAAQLVTAIEDWLPTWTESTKAGLVAPQGAVNAIRAGDFGVGSFTPARAELLLDLRVPPGMSAQQVVTRVRELDGDLDVEVVAE